VGRVHWFSDQVETYTHPAQMAQNRSVAIIRAVAGDLAPGPKWTASGRFERIYLSRADASRRRVANEPSLYSALAAIGFEFVVMSDHAVADQIAIVRSARCVVGPHGMGLTHLSLSSGSPALVELHQLGSGTDAYAFMARAMGFPYRSIVGGRGENDFEVPVNEVLMALNDLGFGEPKTAPAEFERIRMLAAADVRKSFRGAEILELHEREVGCLSVPGSPLLKHTRLEMAQRKDSNVGAWVNLAVEEGCVYTASCWVWVSKSFAGTAVMLSVGEWGGQRQMMADLAQRDCWQRLEASRTAPPGCTRCHVVLRIIGRGPASVLSTGWRLDAGPYMGLLPVG
jgi:hypothetical protein